MEPVTVFTTFSAAEAQLVRSRLEAAGLIAVVQSELAALSLEGYSMATGGIRVQVPGEEAEDARSIIEEAANSQEQQSGADDFQKS